MTLNEMLANDRQKAQEFKDALIIFAARALCRKHETLSPDSFQLDPDQNWDMRKKPVYTDKPLWLKYREDAETVINAMFEKL